MKKGNKSTTPKSRDCWRTSNSLHVLSEGNLKQFDDDSVSITSTSRASSRSSVRKYVSLTGSSKIRMNTKEQNTEDENRLDQIKYEMPYKVEEFVTRKIPRGPNVLLKSSRSREVKQVNVPKLKLEVQELMKQQIIDKIKAEERAGNLKCENGNTGDDHVTESQGEDDDSNSDSLDSNNDYLYNTNEYLACEYLDDSGNGELALATLDPKIMMETLTTKFREVDLEQEARRKELGEYMGSLQIKRFHKNMEDEEPLIEFPSNFSEMCDAMEDYQTHELEEVWESIRMSNE